MRSYRESLRAYIEILRDFEFEASWGIPFGVFWMFLIFYYSGVLEAQNFILSFFNGKN